jgi:glycosyltransferase involved in cell wall biosynthesis
MNSERRLTLVSPYGTTQGGAEQWLLAMIADGHLQNSGWTISAVALQSGPLAGALRGLGVDTRELPVSASPMGIMRRSPALRHAVLGQRPDVVVSNGVKAQLAVALSLPDRRVPTIWVKHDHSYDKSLARILSARATLVIATAAEVGAPSGRTDLVVIEPARPEPALPHVEARAQLMAHGLRQSRPLTLAMIARLVPYKGVDVAIDALTRAITDPWQLAVIGDDDPATPGETQRLLDRASGLGVGDRVFLLGAIPHAGRLLSGVDAAAIMTRRDGRKTPGREGYAIVATEAMVAGIPVIVGQPGPASRRLETPTGPAGLTLSAPDQDQLAQALAQLSDPEVRQHMGAAGKAAAAHYPTSSEITVRFEQALRSVVARSVSAP